MKKTTEAPKASAPKADVLVTVKVLNPGGIHEDQRYECGDTFQTTTTRAAALGPLVEII